MPSLLVYYSSQEQLDDIQKVLRGVDGWDIHYAQETATPFDQLNNWIRHDEIQYLICTVNMNPELAERLRMLRYRHPMLTTIYYNEALRQNDFLDFAEAGVGKVFLGQERHIQLTDTLEEEARNHWRRIPSHFAGIDRQNLPPRAERILRFMERAPIRRITIEDIAENIRISPSHLRKEFKQYFKLNFREFKQQLLSHYETILLFEKKLKPGQIFELFDYKNLSAFSRSFKARHGVTWQKFKRKNRDPKTLSPIKEYYG